jgi:sugar phosphate isomerase/epimerase
VSDGIDGMAEGEGLSMPGGVVKPPFAGIALHTWSIDTTPLAAALAAAREGGCDAVELRRIDFTRAFEAGLSNDEVLDIIRTSGMKVAVLGVEGGWIFATGHESRRLFGVFEESCRNALALGCDTLMSAAGPHVGTMQEAIANMRAAAAIADGHGLKLAFEFNWQHEVINRLEVMAEILAGAGASNAGLLLDAYHLHRSGRPGRGFEDVPGEQILSVPYSDVPAEPAAGAQRSMDRLPPGEGVVQWRELFGLLAEKGFSGYLSYEAPNPEAFARPPAEAVGHAVRATRRRLSETFG